jgi:hypothetical protein
VKIIKNPLFGSGTKNQVSSGISKTKAIGHVAEALKVSDKTISRILQSKNKKPK